MTINVYYGDNSLILIIDLVNTAQRFGDERPH